MVVTTGSVIDTIIFYFLEEDYITSHARYISSTKRELIVEGTTVTFVNVVIIVTNRFHLHTSTGCHHL